MPVRNKKPAYVDEQAKELFCQLHEKYQSHEAASESMSLNRRTYADWRLRGLNSPQKWERVKTILLTSLNNGD